MHDEAEAPIGQAPGGYPENAGVKPEKVKTVPLRPYHDVASFVLPKSAKDSAVKDFLAVQASDWVAAKCSRVFVFENPEKQSQIWGFYSLSASWVEVAKVTAELKPAVLGAKQRVPMALLGYMGRHDDDNLKHLGPGLLHDAAVRAALAGEHLGIWGIWLHAHNEKLISWYEENNFVRALPLKAGETTNQMYAPLASLLGEETK